MDGANSNQRGNILVIARSYRDSGLSVVPIKTDGSKSPACRSWMQFQERRPNDAELARLFGRRPVGVAVLGGRVSGNLCVLEFETRKAYEEWRRLVDCNMRECLDGVTVVETPGGGDHCYVFVDGDPGPSEELAHTREPIPGHKPSSDGLWTLVETKATGGYVLAPGCPPSAHESGGEYRHVCGPPLVETDRTRVTSDELVAMKFACRMLGIPEKDHPSDEEVERAFDCSDSARWTKPPGDAYVEAQGRDGFLSLIVDDGWRELCTDAAGRTHLRRPGKENGNSATFFEGRNGHWFIYNFSSNAGIPTRQCLNVFAYLAFTRHGGDFTACAKTLHAEGHGEPASAGAERSGAEKKSASKKNQATILVGLAEAAGVELFHTADAEAYATVSAGAHVETHRLRSRLFKLWLSRLHHESRESVPGNPGLSDALGLLEGMAIFDGREEQVHVRIAGGDGRIFLDLADARCRAVEVDAEGWRIVDRPPVKFIRLKGVLSLPEPEHGGDIETLWKLVNIRKDDQGLFFAWLVQSYLPQGPYPVLLFCGPAGSAKTTTARVIRALIDPSSCPIRCEPREIRDLMIAARNGWMLALDNLSHLPGWLSDAICRLSTGGGLSTRELYSDVDEILFDAKRPVVLTGIEEIANREDLLDRSIVIYLDPVEKRLTERDLQEKFERERPKLLGALLDLVAAALRKMPSVEVPPARLSRMADFCILGAALDVAAERPDGSFHKSYEENRATARAVVLDVEVVARPLLKLLEAGPWIRTATDLLDALNKQASDQLKKAKRWPKAANVLSGRVRRLEQTLREHGWSVEFGRGQSREITFKRIQKDTPKPEEDAPNELAPPPETERTPDGRFQAAKDSGRRPDPARAAMALKEAEEYQQRRRDARAQ